MNIVGQFSDPLPFGFSVAEKSESSTLSDAATPTTRTHTVAHSVSDEEVILASSRPKRRAGRRIFKETRHPIYRGVRRRNNNKWVCELREPNKKSRIWLGTYPTAEMAARAHDVAALALRGKSACLNFADSAWRLPTPASTNPSDIRTAAAQAAKECKDEEYNTSQEEEEVVGRSVEEVEARAAEEAGEAVYVDEEALSNMPLLLASMAEGLLISPPSFCIPNYMEWDEMGPSDDVSLWSFKDI